jgi:hypothetical protein
VAAGGRVAKINLLHPLIAGNQSGAAALPAPNSQPSTKWGSYYFITVNISLSDLLFYQSIFYLFCINLCRNQ